MRITITPPGASSNSSTAFVLGDDTQPNVTGPTASNPQGAPGLIKDGFLPKLTLATQRDELINSNYAQELPRGNAQLTYSWQTVRVFDSTDNCAMFLRDHPTLIPTVGTLAVIIGTTASAGYLYNAVLKECSGIEHNNVTCVFSYSFSGSFVPPVTGAAGTGTGGPFTAN